MKIDPDMVLQPYGKDNVSVNFIVSPSGKWIFGPTDVNKINILQENSLIFNYVRFSATNPKYYVKALDRDFKIKEPPDKKKRYKLTHDTDNCNSIFFFLFYEPKENFVAMNYTTKEKEYDIVDANMNVISTIAFYGKNFNIVDEDWDHGLTISREDFTSVLEKMKNES